MTAAAALKAAAAAAMAMSEQCVADISRARRQHQRVNGGIDIGNKATAAT